MSIRKHISLWGLVIAVLLSGCNQEPVDIHLGSDECAHCRMMITEPQFASQLVTKKGKVFKFDSIECLSVYHRQNGENLTAPMLWVPDYSTPGKWLNAKNAHFIQSEEIKSPMGESLLALPSAESAEEHIALKPGSIMKWGELTQKIR